MILRKILKRAGGRRGCVVRGPVRFGSVRSGRSGRPVGSGVGSGPVVGRVGGSGPGRIFLKNDTTSIYTVVQMEAEESWPFSS